MQEVKLKMFIYKETVTQQEMEATGQPAAEAETEAMVDTSQESRSLRFPAEKVQQVAAVLFYGVHLQKGLSVG
jgi:hypothetical protein